MFERSFASVRVSKFSTMPFSKETYRAYNNQSRRKATMRKENTYVEAKHIMRVPPHGLNIRTKRRASLRLRGPRIEYPYGSIIRTRQKRCGILRPIPLHSLHLVLMTVKAPDRLSSPRQVPQLDRPIRTSARQ